MNLRDLEKPNDFGILDPLFAHGFRYDTEKAWCQNYFHTQKVLVEKVFDRKYYSEEDLHFYKQISKCKWNSHLCAPKRVNSSLICAACASIVKISNRPYSYKANVHGKSFMISPTSISQALGIPVAENSFYPTPYNPKEDSPIPFEMATTLSGGKVTQWDGL